MRIVLVGASAGLGRALAHRLGRDGHHLVLVASDLRDLQALANDLTIRYGIPAHPVAVDLHRFAPDEFHDHVIGLIGGVDVLYQVAGISDPNDIGDLTDAAVQRILDVNLVAAIRLISIFLPQIVKHSGHIVAAGSVAVIRPRRRNLVYGASKAGLEFYCEALRHLLAKTSVTVCCYRIGFLRSRMTFGQKTLLPMLEPAAAAEVIVSNLGRHQGVRYLPRWWALVAVILKSIPWPAFKRLDF